MKIVQLYRTDDTIDSENIKFEKFGNAMYETTISYRNRNETSICVIAD